MHGRLCAVSTYENFHVKQANRWIRRGKKEERRRKKKPQDENIMSASATQDGHNNIESKPFL